jgi:hypothetical protein
MQERCRQSCKSTVGEVATQDIVNEADDVNDVYDYGLKVASVDFVYLIMVFPSLRTVNYARVDK